MSKLKSRAIPYRVYKKMFSDCPAHDYDNGKITVEFPEDYLNSKMYTPEGWYKGGNFVSKSMGKAPDGCNVSVSVAQFADGGCKYYDATVTVGNTFMGGTKRQKQHIRNFDAAISWAVQTAEKIIQK